MTDLPPMAAPGWYDAPGGGRRFWNGREWTSDVVGAPNRSAEYAALDPYLPPPGPVTVPPRPSESPAQGALYPQPPGWYAGPSGAPQWWDGRQWGPFAPATAARPAKEVGIAYILLLLLGGFAAHRFYVGRTGSAVGFLILWWGGWLLAALAIGIPMLIAGGIWLLVDLFLLPSLVREANARAMTQPGGIPPAPFAHR
jgi:TM2 domain-containing membrane protein YozV